MAAAHYIFYSTTTGRPSYCATGKKAEKAIADIARASLTYTAREAKKEGCPYCSPKATEPEEIQEQEPAAIPEADPVKPGQCYICRSGEAFRLGFENHVMIRTCRQCGARLNLITLQPITEG
jgi:hypothetical protein